MAFGDVVQTNTGTSTSTTTTPTLGSAITAGNLVVLTFAADDYNGSPNAGWTQSSEMEQQTFHGGYLWWFKAAGGDTIPGYTIGSAVRSAWIVVEYEGPFDASPYDVSEGQFQQTSSASYSTANITPTTGSRLLVAGLNGQHASSDLGFWQNYTNSFTERVELRYNGGNPRLTLAQATRVVTGDGSTAFSTGGDHNQTTSQVSQSRSALIIAFKAGAGSNKTITASGSTYALTGTAVTTKLGRKVVASGSSYALTGTAVTTKLGRKVVASGSSYALSGSAVTLKATKIVAANGGTYTLTGSAVTLRRNLPLVVGSGSYSLSGSAITTRVGFKVAATGGTYSLSGSAVSLLEARKVVASGGTYALTGASATLLHAWKIAANGNSYALTGSDVTLTKASFGAYSISATASAYTLSGTAVSTLLGRKVAANGGTYALTGTAVTLRRALPLVVGSGSYALSGSAVTLREANKVAANGGTYALSGLDVTLVKAAVGYTLTADAGSYLLEGGSPVTLTHHRMLTGTTVYGSGPYQYVTPTQLKKKVKKEVKEAIFEDGILTLQGIVDAVLLDLPPSPLGKAKTEEIIRNIARSLLLTAKNMIEDDEDEDDLEVLMLVA